MILKPTKKRHLIWVLLALLGYAAQSMAYVGMDHLQVSSKIHSAEQPHSSDQINRGEPTMAGCHGEHAAVQTTAKTNDSQSCCENGCLMMACHNASVAVLLINFDTPLFKAHSTQNPIAQINFGASPIQSLYRPPIFS